MKDKIIRENSNLRSNKIHLPILAMIVAIIAAYLFSNILLMILVVVVSGYVLHTLVLPAYKQGLYLNDTSITLVSSDEVKSFNWVDVDELTHEIRIKYHVVSLHVKEDALHISLEKYNPEKVLKEILKHIPKEKIEIDSLKNLDQYYYYGKTIDKV